MSLQRFFKGTAVKAALAAAAAASLLLAGCWMGNQPGQGTVGLSKGAITAKGSITVNGVEYSTSGASITVKDSPGADSDLRVGMVVEVRGSADSSSGTGQATQIMYADSLKGPIASIGAAAGSLVVLG
jgi:hypothetical protein